MNKPVKKSDDELWILLNKNITKGNYVFLNHAKERLAERNIMDTEVLDILENKHNCKRVRNKFKDCYLSGYSEWNYCIEGYDIDEQKIRIIISFDEKFLLIITAIRIEN